ncbi:M48 family metallopeptidase [Alcaligenaceae bacterium]|nr:M48 family metallopeptidase [Alcaligenaceae bacterium]
MGLTEQLSLFADAQPATTLAPQPAVTPKTPPETIATVRPPALPQDARWREVAAQQQTIGYVLRRSRRKSIGLTINDDGLQVTAPNWVTLGQIDAAVIEKAPWILSKLRIRHARQQHLATADTLWQSGGTIPYLGKRIVLSLDTMQKAPLFRGEPFAPEQGDTLILALPPDADRNRVRDSVHGWLQQQAQAWFGQRLQHFLDANQLSIRRWRLSAAATRWGSCSSDGNIMLNWRLIHFERDIIDYVIAHEIAHLREMNHSKNFWREVERILPGFERSRNALKQHDPRSLPLI